MIFSTHLMDNAERMCDSVCIIARGEEGARRHGRRREGQHAATPGGDLASPQPPTTAVSAVFADRSLVARVDDSHRLFEIELAPQARRARRCSTRLVAAGAMIERFELVQPSLHRIFLERVGATGVEAGMTGHG